MWYYECMSEIQFLILVTLMISSLAFMIHNSENRISADSNSTVNLFDLAFMIFRSKPQL